MNATDKGAIVSVVATLAVVVVGVTIYRQIPEIQSAYVKSRPEQQEKDQAAVALGFADHDDLSRARAAGVADPKQWAIKLAADRQIATLAAARERQMAADKVKAADRSRYETYLGITACAKAETAVKARLKAPTTAQFERCGETRMSPDERRVWVSGNVDSQNSFGAMLRSRYIVEFEHTPGSDESTGFTVKNVAIE